MNPFTYYLIKMVVCSAILTSYYYVALRNKRFHRWNRFYLLSSVVFSMAVPFLKIPLETASEGFVYVLSRSENAILSSELAVESQPALSQGFNFSWIRALYLLGSSVILIAMLRSIITVARLKRHAVRKKLPEAMLYITDSEAAPFSFFRNIFWRRDISPDTEEGRCVLRHELHHVNAKHSWDKIFMQIVLCAFWFNPLYWLIRKELYMIHEFEADGASVKDNDASALAAMILCTAYPYRELAGINPFFKSPVKRRLMMLACDNRASLAYLRRLLALPVAAAVFAVWVFRADATPPSDANLLYNSASDSMLIAESEVKPKVIHNVIVIDGKVADAETLAKIEVSNISQLKVAKSPEHNDTIIVYTKGNKALEGRQIIKTKPGKLMKEAKRKSARNGSAKDVDTTERTRVVIYKSQLRSGNIDSLTKGKVKHFRTVDTVYHPKKGRTIKVSTILKPSNWDSVAVIADPPHKELSKSGKTSKFIYHEIEKHKVYDKKKGRAAKSGSVSDSLILGDQSISTSKLMTVDVNDKSIDETLKIKSHEGQLLIVDGKEIDHATFTAIPTNTVESINVYKGQAAIDKYGERGRNGVIAVITKGKKQKP
ncbi:MAG: M56 family metallopeptidase [Prevotellaceae bacterium]|jgi:hypothetical protein|nr:M56 family metallopeptidase [Prevotellaceae bacterium]